MLNDEGSLTFPQIFHFQFFLFSTENVLILYFKLDYIYIYIYDNNFL